MAKIIFTNHAQHRLFERKIDAHEVIRIIKSGSIMPNGLGGKIVRMGKMHNGDNLEVVYREEYNKIVVITIYHHES